MKTRYGSLDSQRLVIAHFALGGLSLLNAIDQVENVDDVINWVYSLQSPTGGFYGSDMQKSLSHRIQQTHIASTFSAVHCLLLLGDDLSRVNVPKLLSWKGLKTTLDNFVLPGKPDFRFWIKLIFSPIERLRSLQNENGSISAMSQNIEAADMRFSFCAAYLHYVFAVPGLKSIDTKLATDWIQSCKSPQNAYGQVPDGEAHAGSGF